MVLAQVTDGNDVLAEFSYRLAQKIQGISLEIIEVENEIRRDFGGESHYVPRHGEDYRVRLTQRDQRIYSEWRNGEREPLLARRHRLTERRIRQIINKLRAKVAEIKDAAGGQSHTTGGL